MRFYFQSSKEARETRQAGWPDCKLDPVPPGGPTLPDPRGVGPLFPCAPALLEGPLVENEGLWYQHSDNGCALESAPATGGGLHLPLPAGSGVRIPPFVSGTTCSQEYFSGRHRCSVAIETPRSAACQHVTTQHPNRCCQGLSFVF